MSGSRPAGAGPGRTHGRDATDLNRPLGRADSADCSYVENDGSGAVYGFLSGEPENVDWINDSTRALIHAIDPRAVVDLAIRTAEDIDARVLALPADKLWPNDPDSPLNGLRASHRGEHLDEIEVALG